MNQLRVFISGQKYFAQEVFRICNDDPNIEIVGVCTPLDDKYLGEIARIYEVPIIPAGSLNYDTMPEGVDLGITAHSFDYIGKRTRYKTRLGWIGFHPSLLPLHRGRSAIEWALRMRESVTGGTVFWLNSGIDRGDIAYQQFIHVDHRLFAMDPKKAAKKIWHDQLLPLGLCLMRQAIMDIVNGVIIKRPQNHALGSFEPSTDASDLFRPDLLMLDGGKK
jgi:methionyl-tRNA formyltransferase